MTLFLAGLAAFVVGVNKAGLKGIGVIAVALMAIVYGAKASTGVLLPLLVIGDIMAVIYYKKHVKWKYLSKFLPSMVIGVLIAVWVGKDVPEYVFKDWMAYVILASVVLMFWRDMKKDLVFPKSWLFAGSIGVIAGITTMIGNLAGAFANIFFLATKMPKNQIIGTSSWLFMIINAFKVPFHVFVWGTINASSVQSNLFHLPMVLLGFVIGVRVVSLFHEQGYRHFLLFATAVGALIILIK